MQTEEKMKHHPQVTLTHNNGYEDHEDHAALFSCTCTNSAGTLAHVAQRQAMTIPFISSFDNNKTQPRNGG